MKPRTARLAALARGDGARARRALRRLVRAGDRGDQDATDVLWDHWFAEPADDVLAALTRWRRPKTGDGLSLVALGERASAMYVVDAARRAGHPIAAIARAAILSGRQDLVDAACAAALADDTFTEFCVEHHLAPADPHRAAVFFLLTGQDEKYRLADPDHSLLALAYRGARERERARIRQRAAGDHGIVLALAATVRGARLAGLTAADTGYLVESFARRRDWPSLWALAKDLPVSEAVGAVAEVDGWRPPGRDAALFDLLAGAGRERVAAAHALVARPWTVRETLPGTVTGGSISPDGARIAAGTAEQVAVYAFPPGKRTEVRRHPAASRRAVLALDDDVLVTAGRSGQDGWLARTGGSGPEYRFRLQQVVDTVARSAKGFVALVTGRDQSVDLYLQRDGDQATGFEPRVLNVHAQLGLDHMYPPLAWAMATDPASDRIALVGDEYLHVARIAPVLHRLAPKVRFLPGAAPSMTFCGPDRVAGMSSTGLLSMWRLAVGGPVRVVAERQFGRGDDPSCPVYLPSAGVLAVLDARRMRFLDVETLADVPVPDRFARLRPTFLTGQGDRLMIGGDGWMTASDVPFLAGVTELADRPLAATTPADLNVVRAQLDREPADPAARPFLELLYACLVDRFAVDVAIGEPGSGPVRGDDIALGGSA